MAASSLSPWTCASSITISLSSHHLSSSSAAPPPAPATHTHDVSALPAGLAKAAGGGRTITPPHQACRRGLVTSAVVGRLRAGLRGMGEGAVPCLVVLTLVLGLERAQGRLEALDLGLLPGHTRPH